MKTIVNKTPGPIKVRLPRGKVLHLGPTKTGQISDEALAHESVRRMLEAGEIEIVGEGRPPNAVGPRSVHESTHGHHQDGRVHPKGDR
jgi:hypothetical protein